MAIKQSYDGKRILTKSDRNPNLWIDETHNKEELNWTKTILSDESYDPETIGYAEYNPWPYSKVLLVPFADQHFGGESSKIKRHALGVDFVNNTANAVWVSAGDLVDNGTLDGATNAHFSKTNPQRATDFAYYELSRIAHKNIGFVGGNHDSESGSRNKNSNVSHSKIIADRMGCKYNPFGLVIGMPIKLPNSSKTQMVYVFVFHGSGKSNSLAGAVDVTFKKALNSLAGKGIYPDLILAGHFHAGTNGIYPINVPTYDKYGKVIGHKIKQCKVKSLNPLQGSNTFSSSQNMIESETNISALDIGLEKNPYYNKHTQKTEFEYILSLNDFSLLKSHSDEFSTPAVHYLEKYQEPTYLQVQLRQQYKNQDLSEVLKEFEDTNAHEEVM